MIAHSTNTTLRQSTRIEALDALRGIALLGILFVNFSFFAMPEGSFGTYIDLQFPSDWDRWAQFLIEALCDGKFILIFSFLFGWGFYSQLRSGDTEANRWRFFRRLGGLLLIGLLHACLLFVGDILVTYAILGVPLFWMRGWSARNLLIAASCMWLVSLLGHVLLGFVPISQAISLDSYQDALRIHTQGTLVEIIMFRVESLIGLYVITPLLFMPQVFAMFLVGLAAAKEHELKGMDSLHKIAGFILIAFWLPAVAGNLVYPWLSNLQNEHQFAFLRFLSLGARGLFAPMLTLVYLSLASRFFVQSLGVRVASLLGGEGRSTLSLYIGESVIMGLLFNSFGLAWYGQIGPTQGIAICLLVYLLLLITMKLWLRFFRFGPLEWVLRCLTDWKWIPIRQA